MKILFVCTGNTCRSPMAEGILKKLIDEKYPQLKDKIQCGSAGLSAITTDNVAENAIIACNEIGVDISTHKVQKLSVDDFDKVDLFVAITATHAYILQRAGLDENKIYLMTGDMTDPYGGDLEVYRKTRDNIIQAVDKLLQSLILGV